MKFLLFCIGVLAAFTQDALPPKTISVENVNQLSEIRSKAYKDATIDDLAFQPNGNQLVVMKQERGQTLNGNIAFMDTYTLEQLKLSNEIAPATALTFSIDGSVFAIGDDQGKITGYTTDTFEQIWAFQANFDVVNDLAISPSKSYLGVTYGISEIVRDGKVAFQMLQLPSGKEVIPFPLDTDVYGGGVTFDENDETIFFSTINMANSTTIIHAWDITANRELNQYVGYGTTGHDLLFDPANTTLFHIASQGVQAKQFDSGQVIKNRILSTIQRDEFITRIAIHPTAPILAIGYFKKTPRPDGGPSATNAGIIRLYNTETGDELLTLDIPEGAVTSLAFSPDGTLLASGGTDGTVRLWGVAG